MQLIALTGRIGTGKDEIADALVRNYNFTKMAWADPLYDESAANFDFPVEVMKVRETKEEPHPLLCAEFSKDPHFTQIMLKAVGYGAEPVDGKDSITLEDALRVQFSPRQILQYWGTEYRRAQDHGYWVNRVNDRIDFWNRAMRVAMGQAIIEDDESYIEPGGIVVVGTRFDNEVELIREKGGTVWHVYREDAKLAYHHTSEKPLPIQTGDTMFFNYGSLEALGTGVSLALGGKQVVNTKGS